MSVPADGVTPASKNLRPWQVEALRAWLVNRRGVISAATGGGKTFLALSCYASVNAELTEAKLAVIVPTLALLDQWVVSLQSDLGLQNSDIATYSGESRS